jgi:hypothetical protein
MCPAFNKTSPPPKPGRKHGKRKLRSLDAVIGVIDYIPETQTDGIGLTTFAIFPNSYSYQRALFLQRALTIERNGDTFRNTQYSLSYLRACALKIEVIENRREL